MMMDDGLMMHLTVDFEIKMPRCCRCRSQVEGAGSSCGGGLEWPMPLDQVTDISLKASFRTISIHKAKSCYSFYERDKETVSRNFAGFDDVEVAT